MTARKDPYGMDPDFERAVLALCCTRTRFWGRLGYALDAESMELPEAKLILDTVRVIAHELGHGPESALLVLQRLARKRQEGKVTLEAVQAAAALLDDAEDAGLLSEDAVVTELAPVLKRRLESQAIVEAHDAFAGRRPLDGVVDRIAAASRLGITDTSAGTRLMEGFAEIERQQNLTRMPTGIMELDLQLAEGMPRGEMGLALGGSGDGKSMWLASQACEAIRRQVHTVYATLELPKNIQLARLYSNLTGVPINQILENAGDRKEAERRMQIMAPHIGACMVEEFPPHATTVEDIVEWVSRCEGILGAPVGCVVIDYADKMNDPKIRGDNEYVMMRYVYEGLRRKVAIGRNTWLWTASQASRPTKDTGKRLDLHNVSDSLHKVRVVDLVVTLNVRDDGAQMLLYVAKNRTGKSRFQVGPIITDFERGRITPATKEWGPW